MATLAKHYGPGNHPGSGNPQSVHGEQQSLADRAMNRRLREGGFTVQDPSGVMPKQGWAISLAGYEEAVPGSQFTRSMISRFRAKHRDLLNQPDTYFGAWREERDDGSVWFYLDISKVISDRSKAIAEGLRNQQKAIYNLGTGETLYL